jgi:hypothetical protein
MVILGTCPIIGFPKDCFEYRTISEGSETQELYFTEIRNPII